MVVKNISSFWDLFIFNGEEASPQETFDIPDNLKLKLTSIEYTDIFDGTSFEGVMPNAKLTFSRLTLDEAEHFLFQKGIGIAMFLGKYKQFSQKELSKSNVKYDPTAKLTSVKEVKTKGKKIAIPTIKGIVMKALWTYAEDGMSVVLEIVDISSLRFYQPFMRPIFYNQCYNLQSALWAVASYCGLYLLWGIDDNSDIGKVIGFESAKNPRTLRSEGVKVRDRSWRILGATVKDRKTNQKRPTTPFDIVRNLAEQYGVTFGIINGGLYFGGFDGLIGEDDLKEVTPEKLYVYRDAQVRLHKLFGETYKEEFPQFSHLSYDVFSSVSLGEGMDGQSNSTQAMYNNVSDRSIYTEVQKKSKKNVSINPFNRKLATHGLGSNAATAGKHSDPLSGKATSALTSQKIRGESLDVLNFPAPVYPIKATDNKYAASLHNQKEIEKNKKKVKVVIEGAEGDALFRAGSVFSFYGLLNKNNVHSGNYIAESIVHTWTQDTPHTMSIKGYKPTYPEAITKEHIKDVLKSKIIYKTPDGTKVETTVKDYKPKDFQFGYYIVANPKGSYDAAYYNAKKSEIAKPETVKTANKSAEQKWQRTQKVVKESQKHALVATTTGVFLPKGTAF